MKRSAMHMFLLLMCLTAQVLCGILPQGAPLCVRSALGLPGSIEHVDGTRSGPSAQDCCCCEHEVAVCNDAEATVCEDLSEGDEGLLPERSPCRDPGCMLCLKAPHAMASVRNAETRDVEAQPMYAAHVCAAPVLFDSARALAHRGRPPPDMQCDRSRCLVGSVILVV